MWDLNYKTLGRKGKNKNLRDFKLGCDFLAMTPKVYVIKKKINKTRLNQNLRNLCFKLIKKVKEQYNTLANHRSIRDFI